MRNPFGFGPFKFLLILFVFVTAVSAQKATPTPLVSPVSDDTGPTKVFEVRLPVTVTQKKNLISGLTRGDFQIFEDGVQQEVTFFSSDKTNPPVYVGVLMDTSPSAAGKITF